MEFSFLPSVWSSFFGNDPELVSAVTKRAQISTYNSKQYILSQQDKSRDVFYMLLGRAKAMSLSADGREVWLDTINPGNLFGEVAALGSGSRTATVVAKTRSEVARIRGDDFLELMEEFGSIGVAVSKLLVRRIDRTTRRMCELSSLSTPGRVCAELLRMAEYKEAADNARRIIPTIPPNTEIAALVNASRESVSRTLSELEREGVIVRAGARIEIIAPDRLIEMVR
jgi:CRP/FNR family transcriptional regulator, cyclic AMP receptor protein